MLDKTVRHLQSLPLFTGVPLTALARLAACVRPVGFTPGEVLFRRGDPAEGMVLVLDGLVRIHLTDAKGREIMLALVGAGEPIGEIALLDGGLRSADATAFTPVAAMLLRHADAAAIIAGDAAVATALLRAMAARVRRLTDQVEAIGLQPLAQRVAAALLHLAAVDPSGLVRVAQGQLATLVAASRPKVNAVLADYRARGLIASVHAGLKLLDPAGLRALAADE